jgi:hypothetical protein
MMTSRVAGRAWFRSFCRLCALLQDRAKSHVSSKKLRCTIGLLLAASCNFPRPAHIGDDAPSDDDVPGSVTCQLTDRAIDRQHR